MSTTATNDVFAGLMSRLKPRPSDVVGIDIGASGVKAVRLRASRRGGLVVAAADILPPMEMATVAGATRPLSLPQELQAWAAAVAYSFPKATVKLLRLPADKIESAKYPDLLGLQLSSEYRFGHLAQPGGGGAKSRWSPWASRMTRWNGSRRCCRTAGPASARWRYRDWPR